MKWFVYILSLYLLAISCIPCTDEVATLDNSTQTILLLTDTQTDASQETDLCSPLCVCSCCAGFVLSTVQHTLPKAIGFSQAIKSLYKQESLSCLSFSIWQPPKI
jgi:hypothetical protein